MDKPSYEVGTVLAVLDYVCGDKVIVVSYGPTGVPIVVPYNHWRPGIAGENSIYRKILHWAPRQRLETPKQSWKDSSGVIHTLNVSGWNVYGYCTAICPNQQLPDVDPLPVKSERPYYPVGTILKTEEMHGAWELIRKWKVIGYTKKGTPRVMRLQENSVTTIMNTLRWTKLGWKLGKYLVKESE